MQQSKFEQDRCILFPRSQGAVDCIEGKEIDSRYEIDFIDLNYSQISKLELFGFFSLLTESKIKVSINSFVKLDSNNMELIIRSALLARKETKDKSILRLIDTFIEKANKSKVLNLPIWFNI